MVRVELGLLDGFVEHIPSFSAEVGGRSWLNASASSVSPDTAPHPVEEFHPVQAGQMGGAKYDVKAHSLHQVESTSRAAEAPARR